MFSFSLTPEQQELKDSAIQFSRKIGSDDIIGRDRNSDFSRKLWREYADYGAMGLIVPDQYGGSGLDFVSSVAVMEGLGYGSSDMGLVFSINAHIWSCEGPLLAFGNEYQKTRYLPALCSGELIGVHAMTEPDSGSDAFSLKTVARRENGSYIINGTKTFITNGNEADLILVFANIEDCDAPDRLSCILVETNTPGFSKSKNIEKMGLRTSPFCQLYFDNCKVPMENIIGKEGSGRQIFSHSMAEERAFILAAQIGAMEKQLEECTEHAKMRTQFDKPIFEFQSISNLLADMKIRLETSRLLLYKVAWLKDQHRNATQESAMAKLYISECAVQNSISAMRIHGGSGYTTDIGQERKLRDSLGGLFYSGTSEIMRTIIAELLD